MSYKYNPQSYTGKNSVPHVKPPYDAYTYWKNAAGTRAFLLIACEYGPFWKKERVILQEWGKDGLVAMSFIQFHTLVEENKLIQFTPKL